MNFAGVSCMPRNYYITTSGKLKRKSNTLYLINDSMKKAIPIKDVENIYCFGRLSINSHLLDFLAQNKVTVHFFNYYSFYSGTYYPREYLTPGLCLVKQVEHFLDKEKRVIIAKQFVSSALYGIYKNIKRYEKRFPQLSAISEKLKIYKEKINLVKDISEMMGIEGNFRKKYYEAFEIILGENFALKKRIIRPPDNMINCLISFGNSLVYTQVLSQIYHTHLNPTISYLHEPGIRKRFSLSLDIAEIFKPIISDRILFKLINEKIIQDNDFDKKLNYCYLKDNGVKKFLKEFDKSLSSTTYCETLKRKISMKKRIRIECYKLTKHLLGDKEYFALRYKE